MRFYHGLGDCIIFNCVLKHLKKYKPDIFWGVECVWGQHSCFEGVADAVHPFNSNAPWRDNYDEIINIPFNLPNRSWSSCPSTKVPMCLQNTFPDIPVDENLCRYSINISEEARSRVDRWLEKNKIGEYGLIHANGNHSPEDKDITDQQMEIIGNGLQSYGITPVFLDWSGGVEGVDGFIVPFWGDKDLWADARKKTGNAGTIAALAEKSLVNFSIDSGPGHIFGCVDTPNFCIWTNHHPIHCFDLSESTCHIIPSWHEKLIQGQEGLSYFKNNYDFEEYEDLTEFLRSFVKELFTVE